SSARRAAPREAFLPLRELGRALAHTSMNSHVSAAALLLLMSACSHQPPEPASAPQARPAASTVAATAATARQVRLAQVTAAPGPSSTDIKREISGISDELTECYIAGTFKDSQLEGTVKVTFVIDTDGRVSRAVDSGSDLADPEV